jgi:integrase
MANRTLNLIRKVFNFAISRDLVEANPCSQVEPPGRETPRQRVLEDGELKAVWKAFDRLPPLPAALFKLRTLTLQRGGEVKTMKWADLDLRAGWWTIPPTFSKNKLAHRVPLAPAAVKILEALRPLAHASGWVFPSPRKPARHVADLSYAMKHLRKWSEVEFRGHDLRRTGATKLASMGVPRLVISKLLNHSEAGITSIYDRHSYDPEKRRALEKWTARLLRVTGEDATSAKVVSLR